MRDSFEHHEYYSPRAYEIKVIEWSESKENRIPILLQDKNGPCPLIALVNTLVLRNAAIKNRTCGSPKENDHLVEELEAILVNYQRSQGCIETEVLLASLESIILVKVSFSEISTPGQENVETLLKNVRKLHQGLPVNPNVLEGTFPSNDISTKIFEIFGLSLRHGWCFSEEDETIKKDMKDEDIVVLAKLLRKYTLFDDIQEHMVKEPHEEHQVGLRSVSNDVQTGREVLRKWFQYNKTQLTGYGIKMLNSIKDGDFVVFFRNNHFNTLYKKGKDEFYLLVTDSSFNKDNDYLKEIVWQSLISVSGGEDLFFNGEFFPVFIDQEIIQGDEGDYFISRQLQEQEDAEAARRYQHIYEKESQNLDK